LTNINKGLLLSDKSSVYNEREDEGWARINRGILSCNKNLLVYIAAEFDRDAVSDDQLQTIAERIDIS